MDTVNGEVLTYVQGGSGVRTFLKFPDLDTLIGKGFSINKAELSFDVLQYGGPICFLWFLIVIQDQDTVQRLIKDYQSDINSTGGTVARTDVREFNYTFNVTRMVHDFVTIEKTFCLYSWHLLRAAVTFTVWFRWWYAPGNSC